MAMVEPLRAEEELRSFQDRHHKLPLITRKLAKKRCSDCSRGTYLEWQSIYGGPIEGMKYRLCQGCAKRRGPPYATALRNFLNNKWLEEAEIE